MTDIRNSQSKLVCRVDEKNKLVEIVQKGICTQVRFLPDGSIQVVNQPIIPKSK